MISPCFMQSSFFFGFVIDVFFFFFSTLVLLIVLANIGRFRAKSITPDDLDRGGYWRSVIDNDDERLAYTLSIYLSFSRSLLCVARLPSLIPRQHHYRDKRQPTAGATTTTTSGFGEASTRGRRLKLLITVAHTVAI